MAVEPENSHDDKPPQHAKTVTSEEFAAVDVEAPIRASQKVDCWSLGNLYQTAASEQGQNDNSATTRVFDLLSAVLKIHLKPEDRSEPYGPFIVMDGRRSLIPADLRGDQSVVIGELVPTIQNPGLRARLADIVWINDRSLAATASHAIDAYCESVQLVLDNEAQFFNEDRTPSGHDGRKMLHRACQIAHATGWKDPQALRLKTLLCAVIQDSVQRRDHHDFFNAADIALQYAIDDPAQIAANAESFAASEHVGPHWSHDLWKIAARAYAALRNQEDRNRCLVAAAESHMMIADTAGGEGMVAAGAIMDTIQELRHLPNTRNRRQELEEKLRRAQASVRDDMGVISTEFDLTDFIEHARERVSGVSLPQALRQFADLTTSPDPDELREQARRVADENPLSSIIPTEMLDEDGKVVAKSPGMRLDGTDSDVALHHLIARHENLRRQAVVSGLIEPARRLIWSQQSLHQHHLFLIAAMTPYVPGDRAHLVTTGFARFFGGDFFSALHILVPQFEHSLRHILKQAGVEPSAILSDMTQESRTLSVMLDKERAPLEGVLGPPLVFEIENLFDFRGGPAIRHQVAHGLLSAAECNGTDSIYACWFIFRLFCLPLFPHWEKITRHLDQL